MRTFVALLRGSLVCAACLGILLPQAALASTPAMTVPDVALLDGGVLIGQLVDAQGQALASAKVTIGVDGQALAQGATDREGRFAFSGLRGGVYQLSTDKGATVYRVWANGTAPPAAQQGVMLVNGDQLVRGQWHGTIMSVLSNPWVLALLVATAITVPLVVDNDTSPTS